MKKMKPSEMPGWPGAMSVELAAAYVGMGPSLFLAEVKAKRAPQHIWLSDGRRGWLRDQLDDWLRSKLPEQTRGTDLSVAINAHRTSVRSRIPV